MKKILLLGMACFIGAAIDSTFRHATQFSELSLIGKTFVIGFCGCLGYLTLIGLISVVNKIRK